MVRRLLAASFFAGAVCLQAGLVDDPVSYEIHKALSAPTPLIYIAGAGGVDNGDFSAGLTGWSATGDVSVAAEEAVLADALAPSAILHQPVSLGTGDYVLEFDFRSALSDEAGQGAFLDTFFASLYFVDDLGSFSIPSNAFDDVMALVDVDANGAFNVNGAIAPSVKGGDWLHFAVTFNNAHAYAIPAFELADLNGESGDSSFFVDNVQIAVVPEPAAWLLALAGAAVVGLRRRRAAALLVLLALPWPSPAQETAPQFLREHLFVRTANERSTLDRRTGEIVSTVDVALLNLGGREVRAPLHALVDVSTNGVLVTGTPTVSNGAPHGQAYVDLSPLLAGGRLAANGTIAFSLAFRRPRDVAFTYAIAPWGAMKDETAPVLAVGGGPYHVDEGGTLTIPVSASDPDGDVVTLAAVPFISNATFAANAGAPAGGTFTFEPAFDQAGAYAVQFRAMDALGLTDVSNILIVVSNVNRAPAIAPVAARTVREGGLLLVELDVSDPDDDPLAIDAAPLPDHAVFSEATRTLLFAPDFDQAGGYDIAFSARDGAIGSGTQVLHIAVEDVPPAVPGDTNQLTLVVDPVQSPTLLAVQRLTGAVNVGTNVEPKQPATAALITGLSPANARQGQSTNVLISGQGSGLFATHFDGSSQAFFGAGVQVHALTVLSATQALAAITVAPAAASGIRNVSVVTSNETAISLVAFNVDPGLVTLTGTLIDSATSNAIANAIVTVEGTGFSTVSNPDGTFTLAGFPAGEATLVINPPNHELLRVAVNTVVGQTFQLGFVPTAATVFDPGAPASVSLLSVLGRGVGAFAVQDREKTKQAIRDVLLLTGGQEAGVLDAFGNQLNGGVNGAGLVSLLDKGVEGLADRAARGESVGLAEILHAFSFAFEWTGGDPLTLAEWLDGLQQMANQAWAQPTDPNSYLPIAIFNHGTTLLPDPPALTPLTRMNPVQTYLFTMSLLSYMADPDGTSLAARARSPRLDPAPSAWAALADWAFAPSARADDPPPPPADRRWTSYWRGFNDVKNNFMTFQLNSAVQDYGNLALLTLVAACAPNVPTALFPLAMAGAVETRIATTLLTIELAQRVPEPPRITGAETLLFERASNGETTQVPRVRVTLRRSPSDPGNDSRYFYVLYRFRNFNEGRQVAGFGPQPTDTGNTVTIVDLAPTPGSFFYAATLVRVFNPENQLSPNDLNNAVPWWNVPIAGLNDPVANFLRTNQKLVSDYSDPFLTFVGPETANVPINHIEVGPADNAVYYALAATNIFEQLLYRIPDLGNGTAAVFAAAGFAAPGFDGLAVDAQGDLYSHNKASDALFGGRLFRFDRQTGAREHVGQVNYYSRDLAFANPVDARTLSMGPPLSPGVSAQDLYTIDLLPGQIKRAPVRAAFDPFRRVGQPFAFVPLSGRPVDMEHDHLGNTYLLIADAFPRVPFNDKEKGPMHKPPGAPLKDDCPPDESNPYVDPVYLFSGEFYETVEDIRLKGRGLDFVWTRKYRSKIGANTAQGNSWDYSYNIFLTKDGQNVTVHDGHSRSDTYEKSGADVWTLREFFRELRLNPDSSYSLVFEDGGRWDFHPILEGVAASGRITASVDRHGNTLSFFYDALGRLERVNDTLGHDIFIAYNADGRIDSIADFAGRTWHYAYYGNGDPNGNPGDLKSVTTPAVTGTPNGNDFPSGKTTTYTYSTGQVHPALNGNLLTITDAKGQTWLKNTYADVTDPDDFLFDRIVRQAWGFDNEVVNLAYVQVNPTPANGGAILRAILNDRKGHVKEYFYNLRNECTIERVYTGAANPVQPTTDTANRPGGKLRPTDPDFFETRYEWNDDALKRRIVHPNGNITEYVYESDLDPDAPARTRANIRAIRHLPGTHTPAGDQALVVEEFAYDTSFGRGCCGFNFAVSEKDGRGNETVKDYDAQGNLIQVVNRIGSIVEDYEYNAFGQLTKITHPDNGSGHRRVDRMIYYTSGPMNGHLHQLIVDEGGLNLATTYEYDARGNVVRIVDPRGNDTLIAVNQLDQPVRERSAPAAGGAGYEKLTYYDANDNVVRVDHLNADEDGAIQPNSHFTSTYAHDLLNHLIRQTDEVAEGQTVSSEYAYDRNRNRVLVRYGAAVDGSQPGNVEQNVYDERDLPFRVTRGPGTPEQTTVQMDYDGNGNLVRMAGGLESEPRVATFVYDGYDRKVRETDPMGNVTAWEYDAQNQPVRIVQFGQLEDVPGDAGNVRLGEVRTTYDAMDRPILTERMWFDPVTQAPLGGGAAVTMTDYNDCSQVVRTVDPNGSETRTFYDGAGRVLRTEDHLTNSITHFRDAAGNVTGTLAVERPSGGGAAETYTATNVYDNLNRLLVAVDTAGNTNRYGYDSRNNRVLAVDARGNVARMEFDGLNRMTKSTRFLTGDGTGTGAPAGVIEHTFAWDASSRMVARTDGNGNAMTYLYDALNRVRQANLPDGRVAATQYDTHGNIATHTDPNGTVIAYAYDANERLLRKNVAPGPGVGGAYTFEAMTYDGLGRVVRAENDDTAVARTWDSLSRMTSETLHDRTVALAHDAAGNVTRVAYPGGRVISNAFDRLNRRAFVREGATNVAAFGYLGPSRLGRVAFANDTVAEYEYDPAQRVSRTRHTRDPGGANEVLDDRAYAWDPAYNKSAWRDLLAGATNRYAYDSVNRLVRSERTGGPAVDYAFDPVHNRTAVAGGPDAGAYTRTGDDAPMNQYTATPFDARAYDANGNLVVRDPAGPGQHALAFDYRNQLVAYTNTATGVGVRYRYDVFGRRIGRQTFGPAPSHALYGYLDWHVIEEFDGATNSAATYVYGDRVDHRLAYRRGGQDRYYHTDDLGNVTRITDAAGAVVEQYEYGDYGAVTIRDGGGTPLAQTAVGNAYLFNGREFDAETECYHFRTRYLDPRAGRFVSRDRIGIWGDPHNLGNAQAYAGNNPWSATDPFGESSAEAVGGFIAGGGSLAADAWMAPGMLVASIPDMAVGAWNAATHPADTIQGTWNSMSGFFTEVAAHPDGIGWGYLSALGKRMFPGMLRKGHCWEYLTSYEQGYAWGRQSAEIGTAAFGGGATAYGMRRAATWYIKDFRPNVRPGIWFRTDAGFRKMGMFTRKEYNMLRAEAKRTGKPVIVSGSFSETRVGFKRRFDPEAQPYLPAYRQGKTRSGLLDGSSKPDLDIAELSGLTPDEFARIQKKMPDVDVGPDYKMEYGYTSEAAFGRKGGALVFHPDGTVTRVDAVWQRPHFEMEGRAGLHRQWWGDYDK